jgi:hypothetical protein
MKELEKKHNEMNDIDEDLLSKAIGPNFFIDRDLLLKFNGTFEDLLALYYRMIKPVSTQRKKLWYWLYKYWHEPYNNKLDEEDRMKQFKQEMEKKIYL